MNRRVDFVLARKVNNVVNTHMEPTGDMKNERVMNNKITEVTDNND